MKRLGTFWAGALAIALATSAIALASPARAQVDTNNQPELSQDWAARLGVWFANSNSVRNKIGTFGISGVLERRVYVGQNYRINIGIGYNGFDTVYDIPILANIVSVHNNLRYGIGAGYSFGRRLDGRGTDGPVIDLLVGYQLTHTTNPLSLDLRYYFVSGSGNELDGYGLTLGYRF